MSSASLRASVAPTARPQQSGMRCEDCYALFTPLFHFVCPRLCGKSSLPTHTETAMNIHEHQAKLLLAKYGVAVPKGKVAFTPAEAESAFQELGGPICAIKSQIHAGGRGKGKVYDPKDRSKLIMEGGVKLAKSAAEAKDYATKLLNNVLITKQTGPAGRVVKRVYIESGSKIARELYLSIVIDRAVGLPVIMASTEG